MKKFNKNSALASLDRKHNHKNIKVISAFIGAVLTIILVIYFSFARFERVITYNLINGTVGAGTRTTLLEHILSLNTSDLEYDGTDTLGENGTADNNLRYVGQRPNNFVYYNCTTTNPSQMSSETCEIWNIIGVMNNIEDDNGNSASRIKIINMGINNGQTSSTGDHIYYSWDTSASSVNSGYGINQWGETTHKDGTPYEGADLMRELNTDYLGNVTVATDGKWYSGQNDVKEIDAISPLSTSAINMIQSVKWHTGTNPNDDVRDDNKKRPSTLPKEMYIYERSDNVVTIPDYMVGIMGTDVIHTATWIGKVALPYMSDYFYSISNGELSYKTECLQKNIYSDDYYDEANECNKNTWINYVNYLLEYPEYYDSAFDHYTPTLMSTINPDGIMGDFSVYSIGYSAGSITVNMCDVFPTLYLKNEVNYLGGDGSFTNPYKIGM